MKPHQLRIEAFGPYAEPVEIGFDALSQEGLFLIHGSTGAGKTFLLDALCFALYGEVSGDRSVKALKSDHASPAAVPRVSLEFSAGGARYLVERSPAHTALKSRGEGTTEKGPQAALYRLSAGRERQAIVRRSTEVTREVEALVGLNAGQFRQVILLPQGKFAEVLRARAEEREALLKTLFDTVVFEQAGHWLEERAKAARAEVIEQTRAQEVLRHQAAHEWSPHAPGEAVPPDQAGLDQLTQGIAAVTLASGSHLEQASATLKAAQQAKDEIEMVAHRWERRAAARARLEALEAQRQPLEALRRQLAAAVQAETLRTSVEAERSARLALGALQGRIQQQLRAASRARDEAQALPVSLVLLDLLALPELEELGAAMRELAARRAQVGELAKKALEAAQAGNQASQAAGLVRTAQAARIRSTTARATRQQQRQAAAAAFTRACTARDQLDGLQRAAREARERALAVAALSGALSREADAARAKTSVDGRVNQATAALVALRQRQIAGMAARLAGGLGAGTACPVCGSLDHPAPARPTADAVREEEITAAETALSAATGAAERAAVVVAEAQAARRALLDKAGDAASDPEAARAAARQTSEALAAARSLAGEAGSLEQTIGSYERDLMELEAAIQAAATQEALQGKAAADQAARAQALSAEIARELGEGVDPEAVLTSFTPLEAALKDLGRSCQASASATTRLQLAWSRLEHDLSGSPFADSAAVTAALRDEPVRRGWGERIERFEKEVIEQNGILASPELVDLPGERPDTTAAALAVSSADAARTAAVECHTQARRAQSEIQRLAGEHRQGEASLARKREHAQLLSAVADRCQGKVAPFISLQRWVLSAYLAEICRYANQRLELMTSGRYQLRLSEEGGRGGRNAGLGLRVLDAHTGEEREVSSLSGGETFQASLALALGVADAVQAHAGGVHLDVLFIDEGFGSLDPDNLQLAMDELDRLREGGRMIGLISHVGALRERIRCGIEVVASDQGSTVRLGTPALL